MMTFGQERHAHLKGELPLKGSLSNTKFPEQPQCFDEKGNDQEFQEEDSFQFPCTQYMMLILSHLFTDKLDLFCTCVPKI